MKKVISLALVVLGLAFTASAQDEEIKPNQEADRQARCAGREKRYAASRLDERRVHPSYQGDLTRQLYL